MITDKFKGYKDGGVSVTLYVANGSGNPSQAIVKSELGRAFITSVMRECGIGRPVTQQWRLEIVTPDQVNTSYWTIGDSAIQTAIDSLVQIGWAL